MLIVSNFGIIYGIPKEFVKDKQIKKQKGNVWT